MPDYSALLDKNFKVAGLHEPKTLTIREIKVETVGEEKQSLPVAYFTEDPRGLVLNNGRYNAIAAGCGSRKTEDWTGAVIRIEVDPNIRFKGKVTGGIVAKVVTPPPKKA